MGPATEIVMPAEEEQSVTFATESTTEAGAQAHIDWWNRLTYIDVQILERGGGGGGGGGKGGGGRSSLTADQVDNVTDCGSV